VDKLTSSTGVFAAGSALVAGRCRHHGFLNSTYGYVAGGHAVYTNPALSSVERLTFSTGVFASISGTLQTARFSGAYFSTPCDGYGYLFGGSTGYTTWEPKPNLTTCERLTFTTEVFALYPTGDIPNGRHSQSAHYDGSTYGYITGGSTTTNTGQPGTTQTVKWTQSTGVCAVDTASASVKARFNATSISDCSF
jgi:hypothetical protein